MVISTLRINSNDSYFENATESTCKDLPVQEQGQSSEQKAEGHHEGVSHHGLVVD